MTWEFQFLYWLQACRTDRLDRLMARISMLGDSGWFWIVFGIVLLCVARTRKVGVTVLLSLAVGAVIGNLILKNAVMRERPCWIDPQVALLVSVPLDYSFPSGHTLASFESAAAVFFWNRKWGAVMLVPAVLISFSRLYLFVHFPTDVLAGAVFGTAIAYLVARWIKSRTATVSEIPS